jgi:hypothetical protein
MDLAFMNVNFMAGKTFEVAHCLEGKGVQFTMFSDSPQYELPGSSRRAPNCTNEARRARIAARLA